ncbi:MAG: hypothetical protein HOW73_32680 [Polyangiaceae bacterium]|nr:hypothetical protein [Polyangiaceae bacterium]
MSGHKTCCKKYKRPKTIAAFAALCYPPNPSGHSDVKNRVHNPEHVPVKYKEPHHKKLRKGWWFRLDPNKPGPFLMDGSGDGKPRGYVKSSNGIEPHPNHPNDRLVCFNATNLKRLKPEGASSPVLCGFTWQAKLSDPDPSTPRPAGTDPPNPAGGWIPLSSIKFDNDARSRPKVMASLKNWSCCMRRYRDWGKSLTKGKSQRFKFRSVEELESVLEDLAKGKRKLSDYFKEKKKGSIKKVIKHVDGSRKKLGETVGILPACANGNKLTDYLPKGSDYKNGWFAAGYTNFSANLSVGKTRPKMAPIGLDVFPAGHEFRRLRFKGNKRVYGFVYRVRSSNPGRLIGKVVWYYGYCDVVSGDPQKKERRYGWVPALAVKGPL